MCRRVSSFLVLVSVVVAVRGLAQCTPGPNQVAIFKDSDYKNTCRVHGPGNYPSPAAMSFPNDEMSAVRLGPGAQVILCEHENYGGTCETFVSSDANFGNNPIRHDRVSSMKVFAGPPPTCTPVANQVSLFEHAVYASGQCVSIGVGEYPTPAAMGFGNDVLSSIKVGAAVEVVLCKDATYLNDCQLFTADNPKLEDTRIGNDTVSSLVVRPRGQSPCLPAAGQVSVYMHRDFEGPCKVLSEGGFETLPADVRNDSISSARVGGAVQLVGCVDARYQRDCERFIADVGNFASTRVGNDRISSLRVEKRGFMDCVPGSNQVSLYQHVNYVAPCSIREKGDYPNLDAIGLPEGGISSLRVGTNAQVCACLGASFNGTCRGFSADDPDLRDNGAMNDGISSVKVQSPGAACTPAPPQGFREVQITNCHSDRRPVNIWTREAGGNWIQVHTLAAQWSGHSCPAGSPHVVKLKAGVYTDVVAVDPGMLTCNGRNDPTLGNCKKSFFDRPLLGQADGLIATLQIN